MSRKCIYTVPAIDGHTAKVYRESDGGEYIARLYIKGILYEEGDYFTDDKADAIETANAMVRCQAYGKIL